MRSLPVLGAKIPRRFGRPTAMFGRAFLGGLGWGIEGEMPNLSKAVLILAPHTSAWDFFVTLATIFALRLRIGFLAKKSLFRGPLGRLLRWLGGIPVDRSAKHNFVARAVDRFQASDKLLLGILPEGTRGKVKRWKTGFYYIALGAGVPVVPVSLDFSRKVLSFGPPLDLTGDRVADFMELGTHFEGVEGRNPEELDAVRNRIRNRID